jgi:hypothetical protein
MPRETRRPLTLLVSPLLLLPLEPRLGITPRICARSNREDDCVPAADRRGASDRYTPEAQTKALFAAAHSQKELWMPGAVTAILRHDRTAIASALGFLRRHVLSRNSGPRPRAQAGRWPISIDGEDVRAGLHR